MQVTRSAAVSAMTAINFNAADKWSDDRMIGKLKKLNELVDEETVVNGTAEDKQTIQDILEAIEAKEDIELVEDDAAAPAAKKKPAAAKGKAKAKAEPEEEVEVAEDEEPEPEDPSPKKKGQKAMKKPAASSAKKPAAKAPAKAAPVKTKPTAEPKERKEGIIGFMIRTLQGASEDKPITKKQIGAKLVKHFPDKGYEEKPSKGMHITLTVQVPHRLRMDRYLDIQDNGEGGYWLPSNKDGSPRTTKKR